MTPPSKRSDEARRTTTANSGDPDGRKGAVEDGRPGSNTTGAPGLDDNGLPNDDVKIAEDVVGAREDESQG